MICDCAPAIDAWPGATPERAFTAGSIHSNALLKPPPESLKGFASPKSHAIGMACRANKFRKDAVRAEPPVDDFELVGPLSQVQRELFLSA